MSKSGIQTNSCSGMSKDTSNQIVVARVLCIYFMISVHIYQAADVSGVNPLSPIFWIRPIWVDILGRASVPALSIVSGFLLSFYFSRRDLQQYAWARFKVLILPMMFWNTAHIVLALFALVIFGFHSHASTRFTEVGLLDLFATYVVHFKDPPIAAPLAFLRDLFVASLIVFAFRKHFGKWLVIFIPVVTLIWHADALPYVIWRPSILAFMMIGAGLHLWTGRMDFQVAVRAVIWVAMLLLLLHFCFNMFAETSWAFSDGVWHMILRVIVSFWMLDAALMISRTSALVYFCRIEPFIYLSYLMHALVLGVLQISISSFISNGAGVFYLLFFLLAPITIMAIASVLKWFLPFLYPWMQVVISGKTKTRTDYQKKTQQSRAV